MTPDMKRLCEAAHFAMTNTEASTYGSSQQVAEAIVRAVLMALREPSRAMKDAASYVEVDGNYPESFTLRPESAAEAFIAMVDAILAEPDAARARDK